MGLPIARIYWAKNDPGPHGNHLHVEGDPRFIGWNNGLGQQPPATNPGFTPALWVIWTALHQHYGQSRYFLDSGPAEWTHMGWYNRRTIGGKRQWSQHAWSNALDIGPYYGVEEQEGFYNFLTGKEDDMALSPEVEKFVNDMYRSAVMERNSNGTFAGYAVDHIRNHPSSGGKDSQARAEAARANERLDSARDAL